MSLLDLLVVALAVFAGVGGYRLGFVARIISWAGLALGILLAARFVPIALNLISGRSDEVLFLVATALLIVGAFLGQAAGVVLGSRLRIAMPTRRVRSWDRWGGAGAGAMGVIIGLWIMLPGMHEVPGWPATQADSSFIAGQIEQRLPTPPDTLSILSDVVGDDQFPNVFSVPIDAPESGPPPVESGIETEVRDEAVQSVLKIESHACGRVQEGSGWVIGRDLVITNAHVVAGEGLKLVIDESGLVSTAIVVGFDPFRDLAVLSITDLGLEPLAKGEVVVGDIGGILGHPGGGGLVLTPYRVDGRVIAIGRDLYDVADTQRDVLFLGARLKPGDSGAPLLNPLGEVVGTAFAIAPDDPEIAYALTMDEVDGFMAEVNATTEVGTGACLL